MQGMPRWSLAPVLVLGGLLVGCGNSTGVASAPRQAVVTPPPSTTPVATPPQAGGQTPPDTVAPANTCFAPATSKVGSQARVVVSVIDSGINPYHAFFRAGSTIYPSTAPSSVTPEVLNMFGIDDAHIINLTRTGNFAADFAIDKPKFDAVKPGELYWFRGTNIIAASFTPGTIPLLPDDEDDTHGVGTTASVLVGNPEAIIVFAEGTGEEAETFAFTHPLIDMITTSYGVPGSVPVNGHLAKSYTGVYCQGKLHFGASDNSPALSNADGTSGPWWSVAIAGWEEGTSEGRQVLSGNAVDFVADFTQNLPYCMACEDNTTRDVGGTSFATPLSTGIASRILLETRRAWNDFAGIRLVGGKPVMAATTGKSLSNWQLRRALEVGAYVPTASEYQASSGLLEQSVPVNDNAPYVQVGWGLLSPITSKKVVDESLAFLQVRGTPNRNKVVAFCTYQTQQLNSRKQAWDTNPQSESFDNPPTSDPVVSCN